MPMYKGLRKILFMLNILAIVTKIREKQMHLTLTKKRDPEQALVVVLLLLQEEVSTILMKRKARRVIIQVL